MRDAFVDLDIVARAFVSSLSMGRLRSRFGPVIGLLVFWGTGEADILAGRGADHRGDRCHATLIRWSVETGSLLNFVFNGMKRRRIQDWGNENGKCGIGPHDGESSIFSAVAIIS